MGDFYGAGIEIWAGFGSVGITEKKNWDFLGRFFQVFMGKKNQKYCIVRTKKLHNISFIYFLFF